MNQQPEPRKQQVFSITSAAESRSDAMGAREKRYAISMAIRTVCFIGAVVIDGWIRWVLIAAALILPYTAVVLANSTVRKKGSGPSPFADHARPEIEAPHRPLGSATDDRH